VQQDANCGQAQEMSFLGANLATVHVIDLKHLPQDSHKLPKRNGTIHVNEIDLQ
jgi:hypothetical protein